MTHIQETSDMCKDAPLLSFGIFADVQYADIADKIDFKKTAWRHYRKSITNLEDAINKWNSMSHPVSFLLQLGDIIDGFNRRTNSSQEALDTVMQILAKFKGPQGVHHTLGNHELYNFSRATLLRGPLNSNPNKEESSLYYSFSPHQGFRIIVLDTFDISFVAGNEDSPRYQEAVSMLAAINPDGDQDKAQMLTGVDQRFSKINGAVSKTQMSWLNDTLTTADQRGEHVIVIGHIPVYEPASYSFLLLWNYDEVLTVFHRYSCVVAYLSGHYHEGGYVVDGHGIHHASLRGIIEADATEYASATAHVYNGHIELLNVGSRKNPIDKVIIELKR